jgi:hypothetical protein
MNSYPLIVVTGKTVKQRNKIVHDVTQDMPHVMKWRHYYGSCSHDEEDEKNNLLWCMNKNEALLQLLQIPSSHPRGIIFHDVKDLPGEVLVHRHHMKVVIIVSCETSRHISMRYRKMVDQWIQAETPPK